MSLSPQRREEVIDALRRGTVPRSSLDAFAVGLGRFEGVIEDDLRRSGPGAASSRRCGASTARARHFSPAGCRARPQAGFATAEVQVSEAETPLHRLETVYRRLMERLSTADTPRGHSATSWTAGSTAWRKTCWPRAGLTPMTGGPGRRTGELLEQRLSKITGTRRVRAALRGYREPRQGRQATAEGLSPG